MNRALLWGQDYLLGALTWAGTRIGPPPQAYQTGPGRPVLALPGFWEDWRLLRPLINGLHAAGHPVHVVPKLGHQTQPVAELASTVTDYLQSTSLHRVAVVGHSMGGLVGKAAMIADAARSDPRIEMLVAICTPFHGSSRAHLFPLHAADALAPGSPTLTELASARQLDHRITSIFTSYDEQVPQGSRLAGATNIELATTGHFRVLSRPETLASVLAAIS